MHAYKVMIDVLEGRRLVIEVPDTIPEGPAEVLVLVPESAAEVRELEDRIDRQAIRDAKNEPGEDVPWEDLKAELGL